MRDIAIPASDGASLLAAHYAPVPAAGDAGTYPTVLVRTPYGRSMLSGLANAQVIAGQGYHVLLVSCRGTFGSGGEFDPGRYEAADGQACVAWLREREWFDGRLGTFGLSYVGFTQWALAVDPPPELRAVAVQAGLHDFSHNIWRGGAFALYTSLTWADLVTNQETGGLRGMVRLAGSDRRVLAAAAGNPIGSSARAILKSGAPWFEKWLAHPDVSDPYWAPSQCGSALRRLTAPTLLVGGWQDIFLGQTIEQYQELSARDVPVRLVIGPWTHMQIATKGGVAVRETLEWLDRYLRNDGAPADGGAPAEGGVRVWVGEEGWRDLPSWPPAGTREERWPLLADGVLSAATGADGPPDPDGPDGEVTFRYDPALPTPSVGGAVLARSAGIRDNRAVEERPDVLVFTSAPLLEPVVVAGEVSAEVSVIRDNPHADVFVRLCDVSPDGRSRNVCDGIVRLTDADPLDGTVRISMIGAAHRFAAGHRLRVQVTGGAHPRFARNPGTGAADASAAQLRDTRYRLRVGSRASSALLLPVLPAGA
jgi:hypothetical protein